MTGLGLQLSEAAMKFVGVPFRLHGRDPSIGLDCIGLVAASLAAMGRPALAPSGYHLRNSRIENWLGHAHGAGFAEEPGPTMPGDLLLTKPGPGQHHLMIAVEGGRAIHAHAGLRKVVCQPLASGFEPETRWRLID